MTNKEAFSARILSYGWSVEDALTKKVGEKIGGKANVRKDNN